MDRATSGAPGLDEVLEGGFPAGRTVLLQGSPGSGKTTLALQFLFEGIRLEQRVLYVTLSETKSELEDVARSHDWDPEGLSICDLRVLEETTRSEASGRVFHPSAVELSEAIQLVQDTVEKVRPKRVVFDSLAEMRLWARDTLRFRRELMALERYFARLGATVLMLDVSEESELPLAGFAHAVIELGRRVPDYGRPRRQLCVVKVRGSAFAEGRHDYRICTGGVQVFPRLVVSEPATKRERDAIDLGEELGGPLVRGGSVLIVADERSPSTGRTVQALVAAAGLRSAVFLLDEPAGGWTARAGIASAVESGAVALFETRRTECSPGEIAWRVRAVVEGDARELVVLQGLGGPPDPETTAWLSDVLAYLSERAVLAVVVGHPRFAHLFDRVERGNLTHVTA